MVKYCAFQHLVSLPTAVCELNTHKNLLILHQDIFGSIYGYMAGSIYVHIECKTLALVSLIQLSKTKHKNIVQIKYIFSVCFEA